MSSRRRCREVALQALYQCDTLDIMTSDGARSYFSHFSTVEDEVENEGINVEMTEYVEALTLGVMEKLSIIDVAIGLAAKNWSINRMSRVDRNILRVATYELLFCTEVPVKVILNEAIGLAKEFAGDESPHFINGVLDKIAEANGRGLS